MFHLWISVIFFCSEVMSADVYTSEENVPMPMIYATTSNFDALQAMNSRTNGIMSNLNHSKPHVTLNVPSYLYSTYLSVGQILPSRRQFSWHNTNVGINSNYLNSNDTFYTSRARISESSFRSVTLIKNNGDYSDR